MSPTQGAAADAFDATGHAMVLAAAAVGLGGSTTTTTTTATTTTTITTTAVVCVVHAVTTPTGAIGFASVAAWTVGVSRGR